MSRLRQDIRQFLDFSLEILNCESRPQSADRKLFRGIVEVDAETINAAISLSDAKFPTCRLSVGESVAINMSSRGSMLIIPLNEIPHEEVLDIDQYALVRDNYIVLQRQPHSVLCSCKYFCEKYICAHAYLFECAAEIRGREAVLQLVRIVPKRKRGRPRAIGPALSRQ